MPRHLSLCCLAAMLLVTNGFLTSRSSIVLHRRNGAESPHASVAALHNDPRSSSSSILFSSTTTIKNNSQQQQQQHTVEEILEQARRVATDDNTEYDTHYHPYRDEDEQLRQAQYWLQQVQENVGVGVVDGSTTSNTSTTDNDVLLVEQLQKKVAKYERRIAKRQGADSIVPSIATELIFLSLLLVVGVFWTTLDMNEQHAVSPANLQDFVSLVHEKGYIVNNLLQF